MDRDKYLCIEGVGMSFGSFEALSRIYPGEYGAEGEVEIRQLFELEGSDASN